jgi:hypothetical protein
MYYKGDAFSRAANRLKRELLRLPGIRIVQGYAYLDALEAHSTLLPPLNASDLPILEGVRRNGVHALAVDSLGIAETPAMFTAVDELVGELRAMSTRDDNQPRLSPRRMMDFPQIYLWGTNERLLNLIENYIGLPLWYHGADIRREVADNKPSDVRQWHVDAEDRRMFRIIIYLNDVEPGGGPFQYIPRERTIFAVKRLRYGSGFVTDERMAQVVAPSDWVEVTGKRGMTAFADTCRVFHRAQPPRTSDRYSITFSWTSRTPLKTYPTTPLSDAAYAFVSSRINERQRSALPERRADGARQ